MDCSLPGSSVHGILQGRMLEWNAVPSSRGSSLTQGSNPCLLCLPHWQMDSWLLAPPGKSYIHLELSQLGGYGCISFHALPFVFSGVNNYLCLLISLIFYLCNINPKLSNSCVNLFSYLHSHQVHLFIDLSIWSALYWTGCSLHQGHRCVIVEIFCHYHPEYSQYSLCLSSVNLLFPVTLDFLFVF